MPADKFPFPDGINGVNFAKGKAKEITPSDEHKTQVLVNSEGKISETTKKIEEPLKQGQSKPTESQSSKLNKNDDLGILHFNK